MSFLVESNPLWQHGMRTGIAHAERWGHAVVANEDEGVVACSIAGCGWSWSYEIAAKYEKRRSAVSECDEPGCHGLPVARDRCMKHYQAMRRKAMQLVASDTSKTPGDSES